VKTTHEIEVSESHHHDEWAAGIDPAAVPVLQTFEAESCPENRSILQWLGSLENLRILDLGCGAGEASVYFALQGAKVTAVDISPKITEIASRVARLHGVEIQTQVMSTNKLQFPNASFDVGYGAHVLHHADIDTTLGEVHRVLADNGRACFWDPLAHNPVINIYRRMSGSMRTPDEHPLSMKQLALFRKHFRQVKFRTFWFTALAVFVRFYLFERVHPSKQPYWKKIIYEADRLQGMLHPLFSLDTVLLRLLPFLRRYCWNIVVYAKK
jgi:ubiquinone/menaquinone biosynthesis C-methylase UbiE